MRVRSRDELNLEVSESGEGAPVMLVHGFGGSSKAWGEAALAGIARSHRTLAVDLHGHGASGDPVGPDRLGLEAVLDDLERVLDAAGVDSCPWVGYSMGGRLTLAAALLRPERLERMVLESASPGLVGDHERRVRRDLDEKLARRIVEEGVDSWVEAWEGSPLFASRDSLAPAVREAFLALRRANRPGSLAAWLRGARGRYTALVLGAAPRGARAGASGDGRRGLQVQRTRAAHGPSDPGSPARGGTGLGPHGAPGSSCGLALRSGVFSGRVVR